MITYAFSCKINNLRNYPRRVSQTVVTIPLSCKILKLKTNPPSFSTSLVFCLRFLSLLCRCSLERCHHPGVTRHGSVKQERSRIGNQFQHGGYIIYQCKPQYSMVGDAMLRCNNGRWSKSVPQCKGSALYITIYYFLGPKHQ